MKIITSVLLLVVSFSSTLARNWNLEPDGDFLFGNNCDFNGHDLEHICRSAEDT